MCKRRLMAPRFITAPNWKQPKCPPKLKWAFLNVGFVIHWIAVQQDNEKLWLHTTTWMNLTNVVLNKRSQASTKGLCDFIICNFRKTAKLIYSVRSEGVGCL